MRKIGFIFCLILVIAGCRAGNTQVPPATQHSVGLTWTAPVANANWAGCTTSAPCLYGIYKCTVSATVCADTNNVAWNEITTPTTRVSGTSYLDSSVSAGNIWYVAKTFQGTSSSGPSNISQATVPGVPTAPPLNTTVASVDTKPLIAVPAATQELAMVDSPVAIHLTSVVK